MHLRDEKRQLKYQEKLQTRNIQLSRLKNQDIRK